MSSRPHAVHLASLAAFVACLAARSVAAQTAPALASSVQYQRWWWAFQQRAYPLDDVPAAPQVPALAAIEALEAHPGPRAIPAVGDRWFNIGPAPILGGQIGATPNARAVGGRVEALAVDPGDAAHWLAGAAQGGVWETRDSGSTWTPKTDAQASLSSGAIAFAPSDPRTIYAGTGEVAFSSDSYAGAGLLKSIDGGATWQLLATATFAKNAFTDIRVDPADRDTVLATVARSFAGRGNENLPAPPPVGIYKSTDGGHTWMLRQGGEATSLDVDPTNFLNQYGGIGDANGSVQNGVYRSTDGGDTWTAIMGPWVGMAGGVGRVEIAIAPSNPSRVWVGIQDALDMAGTDGGLLGLFRTDDAWAATPTWTQIDVTATDDGTGTHGYCGWDASFMSATDSCWYNHELLADPTDANVLYAGGIPLWKLDGTTWTEISNTVMNTANGIHVDQHALAFAGGRLIAGNDGGVWSTTDGGTTWSDHNTGLSILQFYGGSLHPTDANFALGATQDNGNEKWTGTDAWQWIDFGDGAANAIATGDPGNKWAVVRQNLAIRRTTNAGGSFTVADGGINKTGVPFIGRLEKCPSNDDVMIAGTDNLWRSTNFFTAASPTWSSNGPEMGNALTGLAFAASDATCATYAFGTSTGALRITMDGGTNWTDLDPAGDVPGRYVTDLAFDPTDANVLYVTLSGFDAATPGAPGHVFKTTDALAAMPSWTDVSPPVDLPHNAIVVDPSDVSIVWVGTDLGVWRSANGGGSWTHHGPVQGMPNVAVFDLQVNQATDRLVAFTHGRGAFVFATCMTDANCDDGDPCNGVETCNLTNGCQPGTSPTAPIFLVRRDGRFNNGADIEADLGANDTGGRVHLGRRVFMPDLTSASGDLVSLGNGTSVWDVFANARHLGSGAVIRNATGAVVLPLTSPFCPIPAIGCGGPDVLVPAGTTAGPLAPGSYGNVILQGTALASSQLTLAPGTFQFCSIIAGRNVRVITTGGTASTIQVLGTIRLGNGCFLGPDTGVLPPSLEIAGNSFRIGSHTVVHAIVAAPQALLKIGRAGVMQGGFCVDRAITDKDILLECGSR